MRLLSVLFFGVTVAYAADRCSPRPACTKGEVTVDCLPSDATGALLECLYTLTIIKSNTLIIGAAR